MSESVGTTTTPSVSSSVQTSRVNNTSTSSRSKSSNKAAKMDEKNKSSNDNSNSSNALRQGSETSTSSSSTSSKHHRNSVVSAVTNVTSNVTSGVTSTTKKIVNKTNETTKTVVDTTKKNTKLVLNKSKSTIENNRWLLPLKWLLHFPRHWPRTNAILWTVLLLWLLILISMGFGILLAQAEAPTEIHDNDAILAARAHIDYFETSTSQLLNVTKECFNENGNIGINDQDTDSGIVLINRTSLEESLQTCVETSYLPNLRAYQNISNEEGGTASSSLAFNWNRCWDLKHNRQFIFYPTWEMIYAAHPDAQTEYYIQEWTLMQQYLYQLYLNETMSMNMNMLNDTTTINGTEIDMEDLQYDAFLRSIQDATGANACEENMGGTAWFMYTIMTTVGYGNQAPVTERGRIIVVTAGLFSLILFGAVLGLCGYVTLAIYDDCVDRIPSKRIKSILGNPMVGMLIWGILWILYALSLAQDFQYWWEARLPEFAAELDRGDLLWFSYISTSTIGLGDYYLQPEVVFASDALKYSVLFMIGFVFLSTFFGKIVETLQYLLPSKHNSLERRLANTRVLACWSKGFMPWETKPTFDDEDDDPDLRVLATDSPDDEALLYRIDQLKELKPDPPVEEDGSQRRGLVSALTGSPIHSMNIELLQQEETLLHEWLAVVQHQQQRARLKRAATELKETTEQGRHASSSSSSEEVGSSDEDIEQQRKSMTPIVDTIHEEQEVEETKTNDDVEEAIKDALSPIVD